MENKLFNNSFDEIEYCMERTKGSPIEISPFVSDLYEETTAEHIEELYDGRRLMEHLDNLYKDSPYYEKYGLSTKKIERADIRDVYYYFKDILEKERRYSIIQIFCSIAEFFSINYRVLYNDIISLADKAKILDTLATEYGLSKEFGKITKLF